MHKILAKTAGTNSSLRITLTTETNTELETNSKREVSTRTGKCTKKALAEMLKAYGIIAHKRLAKRL